MDTPRGRTLNLSFPTALSATFCAAFLAFALAAALVILSESSKAARESANRLFSEVSDKVAGRFELMVQSIFILADAGANMPDMDIEARTDALSHPAIPYLLNGLALHEAIVSIYAGYDDGDVLGALSVRDLPARRRAYGAPEGTWTVVWAIKGNGEPDRTEERVFLDKDRRVLGREAREHPSYDPRQRPWFKDARHANATVTTEPYAFHFTGEPGVTSSRALHNGAGVFAADISLEVFAAFLARQQISEGGSVFLYSPLGRIMADSRSAAAGGPGPGDAWAGDGGRPMSEPDQDREPAVREIVAATASGRPIPMDQTVELTFSGQPYLVRLSAVARAYGLDQRLAVVAPLADFTADVLAMRSHILVASGAALAVFLGLGLLLARRVAAPLGRIASEAERIRRFDFSPRPPVRSAISEITALAEAVALMKDTIKTRTGQLSEANGKLGLLVDHGIALAAERDTARLVEMLFLAAQTLAGAQGGALYLLDDEGIAAPRLIRFDPLDIALGGASGLDIPGGYGPDEVAGMAHPATRVMVSGRVAVLGQKDGPPLDDAANPFAAHPEAAGRVRTLVAVPLRARRGEILGAMVLVNAKDPDTGRIVAFDPGLVEYVEALAAQASLALETSNLLRENNALMESFILVLAQAIDAKSPYTGGHCARVPVIAGMLARAAHEAAEGPLAGFRFSSDEEWREFYVAAWLHDCGKVTTPEFMVDKATKLETLYNRIHEIRARFEIIWRDLEIEALSRRLDGRDEGSVRQWLEAERERLAEDFAFVAGLNIGGEEVAPEDLARLEAIAARTYVRNLDNRLGLSRDEAKRLDAAGHVQAPAVERLLADRPEHLIPRLVTPPTDPGFTLTPPECLRDLGELHNLRIARGTLTAEERYVVNEHVIQTLVMLENLPFPRDLRRVPEYAGAHHETMTGTGYPRGLTRTEMSIPARIMAIADIFEALTASDRPYKSGKTLAQSLAIMERMRDNGHIDPDLYELFVKSGIPEAYDRDYLGQDGQQRRGPWAACLRGSLIRPGGVPRPS